VTTRPAQALEPVELSTALDSLRDDGGLSLRELSDQRPTLLVLLRHTGCTFCRQTLADLAACQAALAARGVGIAVIGMSSSTGPLRVLGEQYGLSGVTWVADPDRLAYRALEIGRGDILQLAGPRVIWAGLLAAIRGHRIGAVAGDPRQMPGTALVHHGKLIRLIRHRTAGERQDYETLACTLDS